MESVKKSVFVSFVIVCISLISYGQEVRTYDGSGNNLSNPQWGANGTTILRYASNGYTDSISEYFNPDLPNARVVSNRVFSQSENILDPEAHSDFVWVFGQFLDHDVTLTENNRFDPMVINVPLDDNHFIPGSTINSSRSVFIEGTGEGAGNPRQYENGVTSFIDGSNIYGSSEERALWLRTLNGDGKLKTSSGGLLPWNTVSGQFNDAQIDPNAPFMEDATHSGGKLFVAGDVRANENPLLIAMHTLFVREHNRLCDEYAIQNPNWTGEQIYQKARKMIGAYLQSITYNEWLPSMGIVLPEYGGYRSDIEPAILNVFAAAAFRMGHTLIGSSIVRMDNEGELIPDGNISIASSFFNPTAINLAGGVDPYIKGMGTQIQQELDCKIINDLRNSLFGNVIQLDLASINIERGRERGLPSYNKLREDFGRPLLSNFYQLTGNQQEADLLQELYGNIDNLDPWVGLLAEEHLENSMFGELETEILEYQFKLLRVADRFFFENDPGLSNSEKKEIRQTTLHDIIMRNTDVLAMQPNVFTAMPHNEISAGPELLNIHLESAIYPNPAKDLTTLKINSQLSTGVVVKVYNFQGQEVYSLDGTLSAGLNYLDLNIDQDWPKGFYNIYIETEGKYAIHKLIVQ